MSRTHQPARRYAFSGEALLLTNTMETKKERPRERHLRFVRISLLEHHVEAIVKKSGALEVIPGIVGYHH